MGNKHPKQQLAGVGLALFQHAHGAKTPTSRRTVNYYTGMDLEQMMAIEKYEQKMGKSFEGERPRWTVTGNEMLPVRDRPGGRVLFSIRPGEGFTEFDRVRHDDGRVWVRNAFICVILALFVVVEPLTFVFAFWHFWKVCLR